MSSEIRACKNCQQNFTVEAEDFAYYKKIGVDVPLLCPGCRELLRQVHRNERSLYRRPCDLCKKAGISMYSPNKADVVYCNECWYSDKWSALAYGQHYDPARPFFDQLAELWKVVPKISLAHARSVNSEYLNMAADNKNCYMIFECSNNEDCTHCYWIQKTRNCIDCSYTHEVEFSYESDDCYESSKLFYSKGCQQCLNSYFLLDCKACTSCIGCVNLRNKQYCIFNEQYTKEEYEKKLTELRLDTASGIEAFRQKFAAFAVKQPRKYAEILTTENCTGNYIKNAKNCQQCFHSYEAEDNKYSIHVWREAKNCWDCHTVGRTAELVYNSTNNGLEASHAICCMMSWGGTFLDYCMHCYNAANCFGCVGARGQKYCILNKQYSKEEYEKVRAQIIESLKKEGRYGEFFPASMSAFGYNESCANEDVPLTKEQAVAKGYKWEEASRGTYGQETMQWASVPDSIRNLGDFDALKQIFACTDCKKNYRLIPAELQFYKQFEIPLPRLCPDCRHMRRVAARGPSKLWTRQCIICQNTFETPYSPDRPEILYCESCYNKEVV